jgi:phospholipase C
VQIRRAVQLLCLCATVAAGPATTAGAQPTFERMEHLIALYEESWSFDGLFGRFPGANGIANAGETARQVDRDGRPYARLPQPIDTSRKPPGPDSRFPTDLPVAPFPLAQYVPPDQQTGDLVHEFYREQYQIDGGRMDKFVAWSNAAGLVMSYYDATPMPLGRLAQQYVLADNFFHAAFGRSCLNHMWLICACTPVWPGAPAAVRAQLDGQGILVRDGQVTPDGYVVNTSYTVNVPHPARIRDPGVLVPNQTLPTIGDRLSEAGVSWVWYAGGSRDALAGHPDPLFQYHHQPFAYFERYADGTPGRAQHLLDETDFFHALRGGWLPSVSFVKPVGPDNEHPGYASFLQGRRHLAALVAAVQDSAYWPSTVIIITFDENGGRWDHVPPPRGDRWGPGTRVPTVIVSPLARHGYVDHTQYDTTSVLRLIEVRWHLRPLGTRDAAAAPLGNVFR